MTTETNCNNLPEFDLAVMKKGIKLLEKMEKRLKENPIAVQFEMNLKMQDRLCGNLSEVKHRKCGSLGYISTGIPVVIKSKMRDNFIRIKMSDGSVEWIDYNVGLQWKESEIPFLFIPEERIIYRSAT